MKGNEKDKSIFLRFSEREGLAVTFLTRGKYLPPLNRSYERLAKVNRNELVLADGVQPLFLSRAHLSTLFLRKDINVKTRVEPRE